MSQTAPITPFNNLGNFIKNVKVATTGTLVGEEIGINFISGGGATVTAVNNPLTRYVDVTVSATGVAPAGQALTKVDDTNVTLTLGGSPAVALLAATSITVGWSGTLAAGRLNSNVVQAVVNDTNVTGSIAAQSLTLGWTGTLADSRLSTTTVTAASYGSATQVGTFTVSATGRLTAASNVTITPAASSITGAQNLSVGVSLNIIAGTGTGATLQAITIDTIQGIRTVDTPTFAALILGTATTSLTTLDVEGNANVGNFGMRIYDWGNTLVVGYVRALTSGFLDIDSEGGNQLSLSVSGTQALTFDGSRRAVFSARTTVNANFVVTQGSLSAATTGIAHTATWNNAGITFIGISSNITNTNSASGSRILSIQVASVAKFDIDVSGNVKTGIWQATAVSSTFGGTGIDSHLSTGVATVSSGTWSITATLATTLGGTGSNVGTPTDGQLLIGKTSTNAFVLATLTQTINQITVTNGSGTITLSTPQNIDTSCAFQCTRITAGQAISSVTIDGISLNQGYFFTGNSAEAMVGARFSAGSGAGTDFYIAASGATSGGSNLAGGDVRLYPGLSTGTGRSYIRLKGYTRATSTGTGDNSALDRMVLNCQLALTNNSDTQILTATLASGSTIGIEVSYCIEVTNGTDYQVERGRVVWTALNKGGVFTVGAPVKFGNLQSVSTGTLTVSFTTPTGANPLSLTVKANSSLTPSTGYPRIGFSVQNYSQQTITIT